MDLAVIEVSLELVVPVQFDRLCKFSASSTAWWTSHREPTADLENTAATASPQGRRDLARVPVLIGGLALSYLHTHTVASPHEGKLKAIAISCAG